VFQLPTTAQDAAEGIDLLTTSSSLFNVNVVNSPVTEQRLCSRSAMSPAELLRM
jgi:hypothetical protein